ncbi:MAG: hypothetical protein GF387_01635 [Candidatus Portnoybacteria bacterium]|nr:hypothetical protein [Candidatus Portnoybacteria bacterium]
MKSKTIFVVLIILLAIIFFGSPYLWTTDIENDLMKLGLFFFWHLVFILYTFFLVIFSSKKGLGRARPELPPGIFFLIRQVNKGSYFLILAEKISMKGEFEERFYKVGKKSLFLEKDGKLEKFPEKFIVVKRRKKVFEGPTRFKKSSYKKTKKTIIYPI